MASLPFVASIFNCINRVLVRHNIETVDFLPRKVTSFLQPVKDDLGLKTAGIYSIPCECGKVNIGQTGHSIEVRIKEHHWHIRLYHPDKSAVTKHSINLGHRIQFHYTRILATKTGHMELFIREATEMSSVNREEGFFLRKA
jgi:hypothetical protein